MKKVWPLLILALVFIAVAVLFLVPTILKIFSVNEDLTRIKQKAGIMSKKYDDLSKIDRDDIIRKTQKINYYLPSAKDVSILLDTMNSLTNETGLFFESMSLVPGDISTQSSALKKTSTSGLSNMDVSISLSGDFKSLKNFIRKTKSVSPLVHIKSIKASRKLKVADVTVTRPFSYEVVVVTYFQPLPKALEGASEPIKILSEEENAFLDKLSAPVSGAGVAEGDFKGTKVDPFSRF